jgi:hypothetical protein
MRLHKGFLYSHLSLNLKRLLHTTVELYSNSPRYMISIINASPHYAVKNTVLAVKNMKGQGLALQ